MHFLMAKSPCLRYRLPEMFQGVHVLPTSCTAHGRLWFKLALKRFIPASPTGIGMARFHLALLAGALLFLSAPLTLANPLQLSAAAQESPPQITLSWPNPGGITGYTIYRTTTIGTDSNGSGNWGAPIANLSSAVNSFIDNNVVTNQAYEYQVVPSGLSNSESYIHTGIKLSLVESRGKLVLLVDNSFSTGLIYELDRLQRDLAGDGWTVLRHDVSRNDTPANIKAVIKADYNADPANVTAVLLLGHIPIPYSGWVDPDDHGLRPAPTDTFYGDMTGTWTDNINYGDNSPTNHPWWKNFAGDGKYDQSTIPGAMTLQVGRVDLANMTAFAPYSLYEIDLLRRYLDKDHNFRQGIISVANRGADMNSGTSAYCQTQLFGVAPTQVTNYFQVFTNNSYLWLTKGGGGGAYDYSSDIGYTSNFAASASSAGVKVVFNSWFASSFWEWDIENGFLRAPLAASGYSLVNFWSENPCWILHHMALGRTIGFSAQQSQNNVNYYNHHGAGLPNLYRRGVHMSLMGDPTLRMHVVIPPASLTSTPSGGQVNLSWPAAPQTGLQGYHIYRAGSVTGPFTRLNGPYITGTTFTDTNPPAGTKSYLVKAVRLETASGSGTYLNSSQGVFDEQAPRILLADDLTATKVKVLFDKPLNAASAQNAAHYQLSGGVSVNGAALQSDQRTVILNTSAQIDGVNYTLTINNISDQDSPANTVAPNISASYWYSETPEYANDTNTIALWHLNGNGTDASGNGNTLVWTNGISFVDSSPIGSSRLALHSSGTDANGDLIATANIPDSQLMPNTGNPLTFEARMYVNAWSAYSVATVNIATLKQEYDSYFYLIQQGIWDLPANGNSSGCGVGFLNASNFQAVVPTAKWIQLALVFDGTNKNYIYVDGKQVAGPITASPNFGRNNAWTFTLGNFDGYFDEVRLSKVIRNFLIAPTALAATAASQSQINLTWANNTGNASGFEIQRWNAGLPGAISIATVGTNLLSYTDTNLVAGTTYFYRLRAVRGTDTSDFSPPASSTTLAVVTVPPSITTQPQPLTINQASNATFTAVATGTAPLIYQWQFNSNNITNATNSSFTLTNAQPANAGNYSVLITNIAGATNSSNAALTVNVPPSITTQPQSAAVAPGANVPFTVGATGTAPLTYQWLLNGSPITGAITNSYTATNVQTADAGNYSVIVTNLGGSTISSNASLIVNNPPILNPIASRTIHAGTLLSIPASATDPDIPTNILTFSLDPGAPAGANINSSNGLFTWTPTDTQLGTNPITARVTDNGVPNLSDAKFFAVTVMSRPVLQATNLSDDSLTLTLTWNAISGQVYRVEYKTNLFDAAWTPLSGDVTALTDTASKTDSTLIDSQRFYNIILVP
ncbi:MAG: hypothetical protein JWR19_4075 [Pedosphaera sp.]|nr:hypothetical protein [Pedosphaera sp.]